MKFGGVCMARFAFNHLRRIQELAKNEEQEMESIPHDPSVRNYNACICRF